MFAYVARQPSGRLLLGATALELLAVLAALFTADAFLLAAAQAAGAALIACLLLVEARICDISTRLLTVAIVAALGAPVLCLPLVV